MSHYSIYYIGQMCKCECLLLYKMMVFVTKQGSDLFSLGNKTGTGHTYTVTIIVIRIENDGTVTTLLLILSCVVSPYTRLHNISGSNSFW